MAKCAKVNGFVSTVAVGPRGSGATRRPNENGVASTRTGDGSSTSMASLRVVDALLVFGCATTGDRMGSVAGTAAGGVRKENAAGDRKSVV